MCFNRFSLNESINKNYGFASTDGDFYICQYKLRYRFYLFYLSTVFLFIEEFIIYRSYFLLRYNYIV